MLKSDTRVAVGLALAAAAWCLVAAGWMMTAPMMAGGRRPIIGEALSMVALPAIASLVATWGASRRRRGVIIAMTVLVGLYAVVTGFSFGAVFYPALGLLVWCVIADIDRRRVERL